MTNINPNIKPMLIAYMEHRSGLIMEAGYEDYSPQEYLEDLVTDDEAPNLYEATAFLRHYIQDEDEVMAILEGLYDSIY